MTKFAISNNTPVMSLQAIEQYITEQLPNVTRMDSFGYIFFFYGADQVLPFVTIATADNEYDHQSNLNREGVFRVNIGLSKNTFHQLFTDLTTVWDYTTLNSFMPHPDYAAQHFICILNPDENKLPATIRYIAEAHGVAKERFDRKQAAKRKQAE
ncbi:DUF6194 family protein [Chitinophaga nivalis]|uniref:DUF6194 family protein n=1 Tax=Chitinophaga nivalis TaxID=2991709 RepID=A0ABT3IPC3_9BACT|nr:DUF6194 family protein [Chitinophaga nivalis]MCW3464486.1 DUF6194 family protein [Chitinophaga nivalis]MCW3485823.1 DUF6194 family protein [Chitinophaga nivalis]